MIKRKTQKLFYISLLIEILSIFLIHATFAFAVHSKPQQKQSEREKDLPPIAYSADLKLGPFRIQPNFSIQNIGYDSNIFYSSTDPAADYTATPTVGLRSIVLLGRRGFLTFGGDLGYLWFYKTTSQNFLNRHADAHLEINFSKFAFYIEEGFAHERSRYGHEIDIRTNQLTNSASIGLRFESSRKSSLELAVSQDLLRYDSEATFGDYSLGEILNHQENTGKFIFEYQMLPKTRMLVELNYGENYFDNPESDLNSNSYKALVGAEFDTSAFIQGVFKLGYKYLLFSSDNIDDYKGIAGYASLLYRFIDRLAFSFKYNRDTYYSYFAYYYVSNSYEGLTTLYITERIGIDLGSTIITNEYPLRMTDEDDISIARITLYRLGFRYKLTEGFTTGLAGIYRTRRSNIGSDIEGFTILSIFSYDF